MKGSERIVKGQVENVESSKIALGQSPEFNPFLVEPVLVKLLKLVDSVAQLKELRKLCQTWDEFSLKELEDRAFYGKLKAIDLCWTHNFPTKSEAEANLLQFLGDTSAIPRVFSSFKFNFPESWTIFSNHMEFFSLYPVTFVHLGIPGFLVEQGQTRGLLVKFIESEIWGNLKEITVSKIAVRYADRDYGFPSSSLFTTSCGNMDWKLEKLEIKDNLPLISRIFESALASGKCTNLTAIGAQNFERCQLNFPGIDASKLTRLEIGENWQTSGLSLEYTRSLLNFAKNGMKLKSLWMNLILTPRAILGQMGAEIFENLRIICSNLNQFLPTQSSTLENFIFRFVCYVKDPGNGPEHPEIWARIHLPQFEVLHSLKLRIDFKFIEATSEIIHTKIFGMTHSLALHFPKLVRLTLHDIGSLEFLKVNPVPDQVDKLHLEHLELLNDHWNYPVDWGTSFQDVIGSVGELHCPIRFLLGERLPWGDSLCSLHIFNKKMYGWGESLRSLHNFNEMYDYQKEEFFKLNHLKKLDRLFVKYYGIFEGRIRLHEDVEFLRKPLFLEIGDYLNSFKEATELPLTSITFIGPGNRVEEIKEKFIKFFPFPVEFREP